MVSMTLQCHEAWKISIRDLYIRILIGSHQLETSV